MEKLMYISVILMLCLFSWVFTSSRQKSILKTSDDNIEFIFNYGSTESELKTITSQLKKIHNIDIDFSKSTFYDSGKIKEVAFSVITNSGFSGTYSTNNFAHLIAPVGFSLKCKNGNTFFSIGALDANNSFDSKF